MKHKPTDRTMKGKLLWMTFAVIIFGMLPACARGVHVVSLKTEMRVNPVGIDNPAPMLSWQLASDRNDVSQQSYRILVASSLRKLADDVGDLWDSGEVRSSQTLYIPYGGRPLEGGMKCYWKVQVRTNRGRSAWSVPATWVTGMMAPLSWKAHWLGGSFPGDDRMSHVPARHFRKTFTLDGPVRQATLFVCGQGLYEAWVNGRKTGNYELAPASTEYEKKLYYNVYDVTRHLCKGWNTLGVLVGNGPFVKERIQNRGEGYGLPTMLAQLELVYEDGRRETIVSDTSWKCTVDGPIRANSEFDGEVYDARREMSGWTRSGFDDSSWEAARSVNAPSGGQLAYQFSPLMKVQATLRPLSIRPLRPGVYVMDMGQNMTGWVRARLKGTQAGDTLRMRFAETLRPDGSLYTDNLRSARPCDVYIAKGAEEETWRPTFTYHGFRYVELQGFRTPPEPADFEGEMVYDEMPTTGHIETSDTLFNQICRNAWWGIAGNYKGLPLDCPQRDERMGWLGDRVTGSLGEAYFFDNHLLYAKWLDDIRDAQRDNGSISDVSPSYWDVYNDDVSWPAAYFTVAQMLYHQYGDLRPLRRHYSSMKKWMDYMRDGYLKDGLMPRDTYGDWCLPPERQELIHSQDSTRITDGTLIGTAFYYHLSCLMARNAGLLGQSADSVAFAAQAGQVKAAFNRTFFHPEQGCYDNNTVTANILPLRFGMVPEGYERQVFGHIVQKTENDWQSHISTGVVGGQHLMRGLSDYGRTDLAWRIATNDTYPSWGYMARNGATTIWELWNGNTADPSMNSGNHVMLLGDLMLWAYHYLGGIGNAPGYVGFERLQLKPYLTPGLDYVNASYESVHGRIVSSWRVENGYFHWEIQIPCNTSAFVYIPLEDGNLADADRRQVEKAGGVFLRTEHGYAVFTFPSGHYRLKISYKKR